MNQAFWTDERVTGSLLVAGLLVGLLAVVIMIVNGAAPGFAAVGGDLEAMAPYADTFRMLNGMYTIAWVLLLLGFALLSRLLARAGKEQVALLAFTLMLVTGWSFLCFAGWLVGVGAPAVPFLMPAVIGIALLLQPPKNPVSKF